MQKQYDNNYKFFYKDSEGNRRRQGIFAPGLDRFILVDDSDFWITLQTAEILSSKLPTLAYILSPSTKEMTNENCLDYTIFNKTQQKVGPSSIACARQQPILKILYDADAVSYAGVPKDFEDRTDMLARLKSYADFVHTCVYAINLTESFYNVNDLQRFINQYTDTSWTKDIAAARDRSSLDKGVFFKLRNILYLSNNQKQAEKEIIDCWKNYSQDQSHLITGYYKIINQEIPEELAKTIKLGPTNISTFLF